MVTLLTADDADRVTAAVAAAERRSAGEIVTIMARTSDSYHDVALGWAVAAMFLALAVLALLPASVIASAVAPIAGWEQELGHGRLLSALLLLLAAKFFVVLAILQWQPLRLALTPGRIKSRRVRARAIDLFRVGAERRTTGRTGVLLYLSLAEHRAEIVANSAIHGKVAPEAWGAAMAALIVAVKDGRAGDGMVAAIAAIGDILAEHFPHAPDDVNELCDRLIAL